MATYGVRPVPQNIMQVELKLFDLFTVKQFITAAIVGFICIGLFLLLPSPYNIYIPLVIGIIAIIVIFVPFNGEPFEVFVSNYLEAMVSPQRRVWHKKGFYLKSAAEKARIFQYGYDPLEGKDEEFLLQQQNNANAQPTNLDVAEQQFLQTQVNINNMTVQNSSNINSSSIFNNVNLNNLASQSQPNLAQKPKVKYITKENKQNENDVEVKSYIIGTVEDNEARPVKDAVVLLIKDNVELEEMNTGSSGDFQTKLEYPKGKYHIEVYQRSKLFNQLEIEYDPVDPVPINIFPADHEEYLERKRKEAEEKAQKQNINSDVFDGEYDPSLFKIESSTSSSIKPNLNFSSNEPASGKNNLPVHTNSMFDKLVDISINNASSATVLSAQHKFDAMKPKTSDDTLVDIVISQEQNANQNNITSNISQNTQNSQQTNAISNNVQDQSSQPEYLKTENSYKNEETNINLVSPGIQSNNSSTLNTSQNVQQNVQTQTISDNNVYIQVQPNSQANQNHSVSTNNLTTSQTTNQRYQITPALRNQYIKDLQVYDFETLPVAINIPMESNLINIPNTINGVLCLLDGTPIAGADIVIRNQKNEIINKTKSDQYGVFYSYSSLNPGIYFINIYYMNKNIANFGVNIKNRVISPKLLIFNV
ncbi:MAG: PrgI family protein [Candidatus Dojkabacteria bacterium]|nr:PrgI family protein [Candidatus Dojkabacteria bacterium]